jgi:hypothetical protein
MICNCRSGLTSTIGSCLADHRGHRRQRLPAKRRRRTQPRQPMGCRCYHVHTHILPYWNPQMRSDFCNCSLSELHIGHRGFIPEVISTAPSSSDGLEFCEIPRRADLHVYPSCQAMLSLHHAGSTSASRLRPVAAATPRRWQRCVRCCFRLEKPAVPAGCSAASAAHGQLPPTVLPSRPIGV